MRRVATVLLVLLVLFVGLVAAGNLGLGPLVITREGEQKMILFLGDVRAVTSPGATLRLPFLETAQTFERRWLYLNTDALPIQTKDGEQLVVDNYAIWRVDDAQRFREAFPSDAFAASRRAAENRIDRVVANAVREVIGRHSLPEVLYEQRRPVMAEISGNVRAELARDGIGIADVRINRTELPAGTEESVYARMKTERERIARKNRAEGEERARRIRAEADRKTIGAETTLVLSPDSEFFRYLARRGK